ncbi:hypothetical protein [Calidifontibacillus erzurumensis]|uniref:Uncharacterized protein n=1 Tax=Calidifontibacillus erzurumensis TaxID=2741433 RepID=A0A8J8GK73_9BACI|nr:hypothetical protein [Calidifontibacillus erzurumensis]NSL53266.1 hypothetical protein [Calidifontibacillus erzurumensis]
MLFIFLSLIVIIVLLIFFKNMPLLIYFQKELPRQLLYQFIKRYFILKVAKNIG